MEFNRPAFRLAQRLTMPALILAFIYMRMDVIMAVIGGSFRLTAALPFCGLAV